MCEKKQPTKMGLEPITQGLSHRLNNIKLGLFHCATDSSILDRRLKG